MMASNLERPTTVAFRYGVNWIWSEEGVGRRVAAEEGATYEVRLFRRTFDVSAGRGARLCVHITADSHYELFLNGVLVGDGPAKGDLRHQFYDTYELGEGLRGGSNCLAVRVVDFSPVQCEPPRLGAPGSIMTYHGGLAVDAWLEDGSATTLLKTDESWLVRRDDSRQFQADNIMHGGFVGFFERWHGERTLVDWNLAEMSDCEGWRSAFALYPAIRLDEMRDSDSPYGLIPRMISRQVVGAPVKFVECSEPTTGNKLVAGNAVAFAANSTYECVFDAGHLEAGFPLVSFTGGKGSEVALTYAEALRLPWNTPGARLLGGTAALENVGTGFKDESTGWTYDLRGKLGGYSDFIHPDGRSHRYRPMHWRTFRFVRLRVNVGDEPLLVSELSFEKTAYPFPRMAEFKTDSPFLNTLWDTGIRTVELCCHDTFEDCPYFEQLQYAGDSSITSRLAQFIGGETDLTRQAIRHFDWSRIPEGLTQSRYPSRIPQIIPAFSLHWIEMIRDYYLYTADDKLVREVRMGMEAVLAWFRGHSGADGLPSQLPYWNMTDWCPDWQMGQPPGWDQGPTSVMSGLYIRALRDVAWLLGHLGDAAASNSYAKMAEAAAQSFREQFWNAATGLFQDQPVGKGEATYSQYGNALAILGGASISAQNEELAGKFPFDSTLAKASFFGLNAVCEALHKIGRSRQVIQVWEKWREMLEFGLDTWAEDTTYWRSLCHAWSAHPCLSLVSIFGGVEVLEPGFKSIRIRPLSYGPNQVAISLPTPQGRLRIDWKSSNGEITELNIDAPEGLLVKTD